MISKTNSKRILKLFFRAVWALKSVLNTRQTSVTFANSFFVKITINMSVMGLEQVHHSEEQSKLGKSVSLFDIASSSREWSTIPMNLY